MSFANVSVAIATYERPRALERCLNALLSSQVVPREILVVDQSRGDETRRLVERLQFEGIQIRYISQQRLGLSASRNTGIGRANCPVVAVSDDDCVPDQEWVATIDRAFNKAHPPDAMTGRVLSLGPDAPNTYAVSPRESTTATTFRGKVIPWVVGTGANSAMKREWFQRIGGYDERLGAGSAGQAAEDTDLIYRLLRAGATIDYEPAAVVYHERQYRAQRLSTRWSYGYGIGAFSGIWLRHGDCFAVYVLANWLFIHCKGIARCLLHQQWFLGYQHALSVGGALQGVLYGLKANRHGYHETTSEPQ